MKKLLVLLLTFVICISSLVGCVNKKAIKEQLCREGSWSYEMKTSNKTVYVTFWFDTDNTYWGMLYASDKYGSGVEDEIEGEYKIKGSEIILKDESGDTYTTIEYTFEDGNLKMIDRLEDGSGHYELVWNN